MHKPRTLLGERLDDLVRTVWSDVDVIGFCVPADETIGPGDRRIVAELTEQAPRTPVIGIVTKTDKVRAEQVAEQLLALSAVREFADVVPVSAVARLPGRPAHRPADRPAPGRTAALPGRRAHRRTDGDPDRRDWSGRPPWTACATSCRTRWPCWSTRSCRARAGPTCIDVYVTIYVERDSQKAIVLGRKGSRLAAVGTRARAGIEELLGTQVYLSLHVTVAKDWQRDPKQLRKLGFDA